MSRTQARRLRLASRKTVLRTALFGFLVALLLVVPSSGFGKSSASQLEVFSWWTGGGEAHGLAALIKIWNKQHAAVPFKNETVAGGAGSNAKAVLAQRLAAHKPPDSFQGHAGAELLDYIKAGQVEPIDVQPDGSAFPIGNRLPWRPGARSPVFPCSRSAMTFASIA